MKALVYTGPNALEWRDEPEPTLGDHEVLVRVEGVGICGSDMHAYHGHELPPPAAPRARPRGRGPDRRRPERRAASPVNPLVACGACDFCEGGRPHLCPSREILSMPPRPGAFAEFVRAPERNAVVLPDGLDAAEAALTEPLAVSYHAVLQGARLLGRTLAASRCAVLGGGAMASAAPSCSPGKGRRTSQSASQTKDGGERPRGRDLSGATSRKVATARRTGR